MVRPDAQRRQGRSVASGSELVRAEAIVVDAVMGHRYRGADIDHLLQAPARGVAHADDGRRPGGGYPGGPAEQRDLRPFVPLRMVEEGAVVDGDDLRQPGQLRHGVVRPVVNVEVMLPQEARQSDLLPGEAGRAVVR